MPKNSPPPKKMIDIYWIQLDKHAKKIPNKTKQTMLYLQPNVHLLSMFIMYIAHWRMKNKVSWEKLENQKMLNLQSRIWHLQRRKFWSLI